MNAPTSPMRFVPTLTDIVELPPLPLPPVSTPAPPRRPEQPPPVLPPDLESVIAGRVQTLLEDRLARAVQSVLRELDPLVRAAVAQALADGERAALASAAGAVVFPGRVAME